MTEEPQPNPDCPYVTWKDFSPICQNFEKRIGRVEGKTNILIAVVGINLTANLGLIFTLLIRYLGK
jgi:hypothetical protein